MSTEFRPNLLPALVKIALLLAVVAATLLGGCAATGPDLARSGAVRYDLPESRGLIYSPPRVRVEGDETLVSGTVRPRGRGGPARAGHVHVEIVAPDGDLLASGRGSLTGSVRPSPPIRRAAAGGYRVRLDAVPPPGATVRVTSDRDRH